MLPGKWATREVIALTLLREVRSQRIREIVERFESAGEFLHHTPDGRWLRVPSLFGRQQWSTALKKADYQLARAQQFSAQVITFWDERYPQLLREIYSPPIVLYLWGQLQPADALAIAMVGTRRCTSYGRLVAKQFAETFAQSGVVLVSGLAYGIDTVVHEAAVQAHGTTYAVIASGLDSLSPLNAVRLAQRIVDSGGAVLTEYPFGVRARPAYFPQRNRIISGIAKATILVESGEKGGGLITARFAIDQNRELFAIPGNITSEKSKGCNVLIRNSQAIPALSPEDVLESLGLTVPLQQSLSVELTEEERKVCEALSAEPVHIDELAEQLQFPVHQLVVVLLQLEFKGIVQQLPGKYFIRPRTA